MNKWKSKW